MSIQTVSHPDGYEVRQLCVAPQGESVHSGRTVLVSSHTVYTALLPPQWLRPCQPWPLANYAYTSDGTDGQGSSAVQLV